MTCSFLEFWGLSRLIIKSNEADQESRNSADVMEDNQSLFEEEETYEGNFSEVTCQFQGINN